MERPLTSLQAGTIHREAKLLEFQESAQQIGLGESQDYQDLLLCIAKETQLLKTISEKQEVQSQLSRLDFL